MPTKPGTTYTHATALNFGTGPAAGQPTKVVDPVATTQGFIPGQGVEAESVNYLLHWTGEWLSDWISLGTNAADLDAHIVETDANGTASIAAINAGGTASTLNAITAVENSGATATTILGTNSSGGVGVAALASGGGVGVSADVFDTCDGVIGQVRGSGVAVTGRVFAGATGAALKGEGQVGGGPVLDLSFNATNPARGLLALQAVDLPTAPISGDFWFEGANLATNRRGGLEFWDNLGDVGKAGPGPLRTWATPQGLEFLGTLVAGPVTEGAEVVTDVATLTIPADAPNGQYVIRFSAEVAGFNFGPGASDQAYFNCEISGVPFLEMAVQIPPIRASQPAPAGAQIVSGEVLWTKVAAVAIPVAIRIATAPPTSGSGEGVQATNASLTISGVFDV